ncbi:hypothetical protein LR48_Vigan11g098500 [Vigna angularis]|uniref:Uncharacterized protein n=1 Tax=Phaseolus angularis TaxID=3914 RepID=A0A0L9VSY8_PHAAN|nr:hypothetical protein LR48_Vigan11g098500 [Vigna angularis]
MTADNARHQNTKQEKVIVVAEESVNMLSAVSLILSVIGIAEDVDDRKRYATT